jgi:DNA polymerase-3 subunit delta'
VSVNKIYPWLDERWAALVSDSARAHHALLIAGQVGIGKQAFALALAAKLLCEGPSTSRACGVCDSCRWREAGSHPDFRLVAPAEEDDEGASEEKAPRAGARMRSATGIIKIDQVRQLEDFVYVGSHRGGRRVALISPAEAMNAAAANALLKMLEEPPEGMHFLLVSLHWRRLLPTLRSRCRMVLLGRPDRSRAEAWLREQGVAEPTPVLQAAGGSPLTALEWSTAGTFLAYKSQLAALVRADEGALQLAARWEEQLRADMGLTLESLVELLQKWTADLIQVRMAGLPRFHGAWHDKLAGLVAGADVGRLLRCYNELMDIRAVCRHPLNTRLFLEDLAARYLRSLRTEKP